jgi:chromosome segregation ATPase
LVEQALYFAIGFLAAALAATAAVPLVSRRAMRLAEARARLRAPVNEKQAIADADALRAQHAVERTRIERKLTLAEEVSIGLRVAVGRRAAEIIQLRSDVAALDCELYDRRAEGERLASRGRDLEATIGAIHIALHDASVQRDRASASQAAAEARATELEAESSRDRVRIAVASARAEYLEGRVEELMEATKARGKAAAALDAERSRAAALEERLGVATGESRSLTNQLSKAAADHRDLAIQLAELEERLRLSEREREQTLLENGRRLAELADREAALVTATAKAAGLEARLAALAAESHAHENASSLRTGTLPEFRAAMEESLRTAQAEREALHRENESLRIRIRALGDATHAADAQLRQSIERLGREVVRVFSTRKAPAGMDPSAGDGNPLPGLREVETTLASIDGEAHRFGDGPRRRAGRSRAPER